MSRRFAVLADIHGNIEALEAVLGAVDLHKPDVLVVLGDTIGYGPNPRECLTRVCAAADVLLVGNHEREAVDPDPGLSGESREAIHWAVGQVNDLDAWQSIVSRMRSQGIAKQACQQFDGRTWVHASPASPVEQYIWPGYRNHYLPHSDQIDARLREFLAAFPTEHGFFAHTHAPAVMAEHQHHRIFNPYIAEGFQWHRVHTFQGAGMLYVVPDGPGAIEGLSGRKMAINPGSVGQPRFCGDPRASYAIYDGDRVSFHRVPYDIEQTRAKLLALPISEDNRKELAERLVTGV